METTGEAVIRPYRDSDRADCFEVCVRTANLGGDASGMYSSDALMADLFFAPYADLDPQLAFVVDAGDRVVGYVVATANTRDYVTRYRAELLPRFAAMYPRQPPGSTGDSFMIDLGHNPERLLLPVVDEYPAHLHIDILPEWQGRGLGRRLMDTERAALASRGVAALHLTMVDENLGARSFYDRLGFRLLESGEGLTTLGITTR